MTNKDIYVRAMYQLGEVADSEENDDYEERAPYLLAAFCTEVAPIVEAYYEAKGLDTPAEPDCVRLPLEFDFPYDEKFVSPAAMYLAAMLIIDENTELSDKLFDKYCDLMASIQSKIPSKIEKIAQKYDF